MSGKVEERMSCQGEGSAKLPWVTPRLVAVAVSEITEDGPGRGPEDGSYITTS